MNDKQALSVKDLAAPVNKVLEGLEVECNMCDGGGRVHATGVDGHWLWSPSIENPIRAITEKCGGCNGTGKVKYFWQPKVGEWYFKTKKYNWRKPILISSPNDVQWAKLFPTYCSPILEWEEIEGILEKAGYWLEMNKPLSEYLKKDTMRVGCSIYQAGKANFIAYAQGKSRLIAVYKAMIELEKEI